MIINSHKDPWHEVSKLAEKEEKLDSKISPSTCYGRNVVEGEILPTKKSMPCFTT